MRDLESDHLTVEQLRAAMAAEELLASPVREHLTRCGHCRENLQRAEAQMARLALRVRQATPAPRRPFHLPPAPRQRQWLPRFEWRPVYGLTALAVALFLVSALTLQRLGPLDRSGSNGGRFQTLMTEIDQLVENALPDDYLHIAGEDDIESDEDFFDFVIPSLEEDNLSAMPEFAGGRPC